MPELPDLEVIREFLAERLPGLEVTAAEVRRPIIVRNLVGGDLNERLAGGRFTAVSRRGKFLLLALDAAAGEGLTLVINPMLAGRLRFGEPLPRARTRDALVLNLAGGLELRYNDAADMGKIYLAADVDQVPAFAGQGPEATDPALTLDVFRTRLRPFRGEIKGILTNQAFVAGIGNAYADEILWAARIYPFRKRSSLEGAEVERVYEAMREVLVTAIATLRQRVGTAIEVEVRDFLAVHGKPGRPCPRCGTPVSEVKRMGIATHFCRNCQPGLMIRQQSSLLSRLSAVGVMAIRVGTQRPRSFYRECPEVEVRLPLAPRFSL